MEEGERGTWVVPIYLFRARVVRGGPTEYGVLVSPAVERRVVPKFPTAPGFDNGCPAAAHFVPRQSVPYRGKTWRRARLLAASPFLVRPRRVN